MEIEDTLDRVHRLFVRRNIERCIAGENHEPGSGKHERDAALHRSFIPPAGSRTAAMTQSETQYQIRRGMRPMCGRVQAGRLKATPSLPPRRSAAVSE